MEGVAASRYTIKVDTSNGRVDIATTSYTGGIANVGLFVASNVVVGTLTGKNAVVIYATGTIVLNGNLVSTGTVPVGISQLISSTSSATGGSSTWTVTGIASNTRYMILAHYIQRTTAGTPIVRFNGDVSNNYTYAAQFVNSSGATGVTNGLTNGCHAAAGTVAVGFQGVITIEVHTDFQSSNQALTVADASYPNTAGGVLHRATAGCRYIGSAAITSISFSTTAGLWEGDVQLIQMVR